MAAECLVPVTASAPTHFHIFCGSVDLARGSPTDNDPSLLPLDSNIFLSKHFQSPMINFCHLPKNSDKIEKKLKEDIAISPLTEKQQKRPKKQNQQQKKNYSSSFLLPNKKRKHIFTTIDQNPIESISYAEQIITRKGRGLRIPNKLCVSVMRGLHDPSEIDYKPEINSPQKNGTFEHNENKIVHHKQQGEQEEEKQEQVYKKYRPSFLSNVNLLDTIEVNTENRERKKRQNLGTEDIVSTFNSKRLKKSEDDRDLDKGRDIDENKNIHNNHCCLCSLSIESTDKTIVCTKKDAVVELEELKVQHQIALDFFERYLPDKWFEFRDKLSTTQQQSVKWRSNPSSYIS